MLPRQFPHPLGVFHCAHDFSPVPDNPRVVEQPGKVCPLIGGYPVQVKAVERPPETCGCLRRSSEWVAGDSYNLQNERGTTFVFTEIEGVLQVARLNYLS